VALLERLLEESARPLLLWVLGAATLLFLAVFVFLLSPALQALAGSPPPDVVLFQTPAALQGWLQKGGERARSLYLWFLLADTFFPLLYGLFLAALLWRLSMGGKAWHLAVYAVLFDYLENSCHALLIWSYPHFYVLLAWAAAFATLLKWLAIAAVLMRLVWLLLLNRRA